MNKFSSWGHIDPPKGPQGNMILKYTSPESDPGSLLAINNNAIKEFLIEFNALVIFISKCLQYPLFSFHISV